MTMNRHAPTAYSQTPCASAYAAKATTTRALSATAATLRPIASATMPIGTTRSSASSVATVSTRPMRPGAMPTCTLKYSTALERAMPSIVAPTPWARYARRRILSFITTIVGAASVKFQHRYSNDS